MHPSRIAIDNLGASFLRGQMPRHVMNTSDAAQRVTTLLRAAREGQADAFDEAFCLVYDELHRLAHRVRRGRAPATLSTTALVHEAYLKLVPSTDLDWHDGVHFLRVAARAMRQVLRTAALRQQAQKRGGGALPVTFDERVHAGGLYAEELLALDEALHRLEAFDARKAQVVELRFFAGLSIEETAAALEVSEPTVVRDWRTARAWLAGQMQTP